MADIARDLPVPGRAAVPAVLRPAAGACGVILMHGSGGGMDSGRLPLYTDALADAGFSVLRFTIKPPSMPTRIKCCQAVLDTAAEVFPEAEHVKRWFLGGHSMGARVASQCASDNADTVPGVIFSSYPLHPPGEQDKLRDEPLASLQLPILFVRGTRDQFCDDGPWEEVRPRLTSPDITVHTVEGGDHGLKVKGGKAADEEAMDAACAAIIGFLHRVSGTTDEGPADEADGVAEEPAEEEEAEVEEEEEAAEEANGTAGKAGAGKKRASRAAKPKPAKQPAAKETKKSARSRGVTKPATPGKKAAPAKKKAASKTAAKAATPAKRKAAAKPAAASKGETASKAAAKAATPAKRKAAAKPAEAKATPKAATGKWKRSAQATKEEKAPAASKAEQKAGKAKPAAGKASKAKASSKAAGATTKRAKRS